MSRKLIIDGNAVYEIDENCMLKKRLDGNGKEGSRADREGNAGKNTQKKPDRYDGS